MVAGQKENRLPALVVEGDRIRFVRVKERCAGHCPLVAACVIPGCCAGAGPELNKTDLSTGGLRPGFIGSEPAASPAREWPTRSSIRSVYFGVMGAQLGRGQCRDFFSFDPFEAQIGVAMDGAEPLRGGLAAGEHIKRMFERGGQRWWRRPRCRQ